MTLRDEIVAAIDNADANDPQWMDAAADAIIAVVLAHATSDERLEAMARAHDAEEAAQRGEPSPWSLGGDDFAEFRACRIAAMRCATAAFTGETP